MATCRDCYHYHACGGFTPSDLDKDVWDLCAQGKADEIPDIEDRCTEFKDKACIVELHCKVGETLWAWQKFYHCDDYHIYDFKAPDIEWIIQAADEFGRTIFFNGFDADKAAREALGLKETDE